MRTYRKSGGMCGLLVAMAAGNGAAQGARQLPPNPPRIARLLTAARESAANLTDLQERRNLYYQILDAQERRKIGTAWAIPSPPLTASRPA